MLKTEDSAAAVRTSKKKKKIDNSALRYISLFRTLHNTT